jgi:hypothetical protein
MPILVRLSKSNGWDKVTKDSIEDTSFPADVLADCVDIESDISVWQVHDGNPQELDPNLPQLVRVAAALHHSTDQKLSDMTFRVVSEWRLKQTGLKKRQTKGDSPLDSGLNASSTHWSITIAAVADAIKLAKAFRDRPPIYYSQQEVMRHFVRALEEKWIPVDKVNPGLLKALITDGYMKVTGAPAAVETTPARPAQ